MGIAEPLVGRDEHLALLGSRLAQARSGTGRLVLLAGPAGVGKTRLAEALADNTGDVLLGWGSAVDDPGMPPLWPWLRALHDVPGPRAAVEAAFETGRVGSIPAADTAARQFGAQTAILDALAAAAGAAGLLLVLEDLHWADEPSIRLLSRLAAVIRRMPVLVVGTHRATTRGALADALPDLLARAGTETMRLSPLTADQAVALLRGLVPDADPGQARTIADRVGGSPLYLRTIARVGPDLLRGPDAGPHALVALPELSELVGGALRGALGADVRIAEAVSVLGTDAELSIVAAVTDLELPELLGRLRPAVAAGLLDLPAGRVRLSHALFRDAVYAAIEPAARIGLHRRAASALERAGNAEQRAGEIAYHYQQAGERLGAGQWAIRAAATASRAGAHARAADYLRDAFVWTGGIEATDLPGRLDLLLELARSCYLSGDLAGSLAASEEVADEATRVGDSVAIARAAVVVQGVGDPSVVHAIGRLCRRALAAFDDATPLAMRARVEAQLAHVALQWGDFAEATRWSERALTDAADSGDPDAELDATCARGPLVCAPGTAERWALGDRAVTLAAVTERPLAELWGRSWRIDACLDSANVGAAQGELALLGALADRTGLPLVRWHVLRGRAAWALLAGDFDRAIALAGEANALAEELRDGSALGVHVAFLTYLAALRGDVGDLELTAPDAMVHGPRLPVVLASRATALLVAGRTEQARVAFRALPLDELDPSNPLTLPMVSFGIELATYFRDVPACRRIATVLRTLHSVATMIGSGTVFFLGSVARAWAEVAAVGDGPDAAIPLFEEGIRVDTQLGARPFVARGRLGLADALARRGHDGDLERARLLATQAAQDARRIDMTGAVHAADALLTRIRRLTRAADPLTPREREIAELVAQALSNREIAERLFLSERTVEGHVRNILARTGTSSRVELTRKLLQDRPADGTR